MTYADPSKRGQCLTECEFGFTSNGTPDKVCTACDESCDGCYDNGEAGDTQQCLTCSASHPYRLKETKICLNTCNAGIFERTLFQSSESYCDTCDAPCLGCLGTKTFCTSCPQDQLFKNLHQNTCIENCPAGTTTVAGVCVPCESPCATCEGNAAICKTCDNSNGRRYLLNSTCYDNCPLTYANDEANNQCVGCLSGCDRCNVTNTTQCLTCGENLYLLNDTCRGSCPDGWKGVNRVCVPAGGEDLTVLWFPFTIAAFLFTIVVLFAKLKKKKVLVDGVMKKINNQSSIVAIIAFIAPLQTLCTLTQCLLALFLAPGRFMHFVLAAFVLMIMLAINVAFFVWFIRLFYKKRPAKVGEIIEQSGNRIQIRDAAMGKQYPQFPDADFGKWYEKHKFTTWMVLLASLCYHHKIAKLYYSRFYMFDMFKARWTQAEHFKKSMKTVWWITWLCAVDLVIIGICAVGLLSI